jgi:hypothetical protein
MTSGELGQAWVLALDNGAEQYFVPSDGWEIYEH